MKELLDGFEEHGTAPDEGGVFGPQEVADGHGLDAVGGEGEELVVGVEGGG